jgi:hypothetical protein
MSRNRRAPDGYKLFAISWDAQTGQPIHPPHSSTAAISVLENKSTALCPFTCIRPTGVVFGPGGRLYVSSERTGEIFVIGRSDGSSVDETTLETKAPSNVDRVIETEEPQVEVEQKPLPQLVKSNPSSPWQTLWNLFRALV